MTIAGEAPERAKTRLDQWLWFARFVKSRSLAARLCTDGAVAINGTPVIKANQSLRIDDVVMIRLRGMQRTVRVRALGTRRGPAREACLLYEEMSPPLRLPLDEPDWLPLLVDADPVEPAAPIQ